MASHQLTAGLPLGVTLPPNAVVQFEAVDANGDPVSGVVVSAWAITGDAPQPVDLVPVQPFVPVFVYGTPSNGEAPGIEPGK